LSIMAIETILKSTALLDLLLNNLFTAVLSTNPRRKPDFTIHSIINIVLKF